MKKLQHTHKLDESQLQAIQVNMSNALTRSAHNLSLSEKRLVAICIAKTDQRPRMALEKNGSWTVRVSAADYAETYAVSMDTAYEQLKNGSNNLLKREVRTTTRTKNGLKEYAFHWVGAVDYHHGEGWVELKWWHEVVPHLYQLRGEFTKYKLESAAALRSIYSWRLYEVLKSWEKKGIYSPTIEEFQLAMDVPEKYRKNFRDIRVWIIEPAIAELQAKNNMIISYETKSIGRKVTSLVFKFQTNPQAALPE
jgi:plasmid replication initiation protein